MLPDTFHIITFGCQMNVHDSDWLAARLEREGFAQSPPDQARIIIVNTCSVREKPEQKVHRTLERIQQLTNGSHDVLVAVTGCVAQQLGEKLFEGHPQVRLVAGGDQIGSVPRQISELLGQPGRRTLLAFHNEYPERESATPKIRGGSAFVTIMQGCNNFCSYCIVPFTRGREKSRSARTIIDECRQALAKGAVEISLLGQNVNAWSDKGMTFAGLLTEIANLPGLRRLRFVTPHPADMDQAVVECFSLLGRLCPRLHLPLQAGSDHVLKRMRRRYNSREFLSLVGRLKDARPDLALSTDLIVGFPGETEEDFQATLDVVRQSGFMSSYSFCYSDRPGTRASLMPDKVRPEVQRDRLARLQCLQEELTARWLRRRTGQTATLLLEGPSPRDANSQGAWQGRDEYGVAVNAVLPDELRVPGKLVKVQICGAKRHSLAGEFPDSSREWQQVYKTAGQSTHNQREAH